MNRKRHRLGLARNGVNNMKKIALKSSRINPNRKIWRHANSLRRALSGYAVSQHPYHAPPDLFKVVESCVKWFKPDRNEMIHIRIGSLLKQLQRFLVLNRSSLAWNKPKKGNHKIIFTSRYWSPKPQYDFIDLDALAMNVSRELLRED